MELREAVLRVQQAYPRIYLACHSRHQNVRTTASNISQRDATLLAHLSERDPTPQSSLAQHLGVAKSTLSAALCALEECGFIVRCERSKSDVRASLVLRTAAGTRVMSESSVLEEERLRNVLRALTSDERARAIDGLELIARAAHKISMRKRKPEVYSHERSGNRSKKAVSKAL